MIEDVIILAGGEGSRLEEYTEKLPKPLVEVAGAPIIVHVIEAWKQAGAKRFIIAGGYKFSKFLDCQALNGFNVVFVDTFLETQTAGRIKKCLPVLNSNVFGLSYGDGITTFPLEKLYYNHIEMGKIITMLVTQPPSRFGEIKMDTDGTVTEFLEKPMVDKLINGGYFICDTSIGSYINKNSDILETDVMSRLVEERKLGAVRNDRFWRCMDTPKDVKELNDLWKSNEGKWE